MHNESVSRSFHKIESDEQKNYRFVTAMLTKRIFVDAKLGPTMLYMYRVLQAFEVARTKTEAWRASGISKKNTFFNYLKEAINFGHVEFSDSKGKLTDRGRSFMRMLEPFARAYTERDVIEE